ncbi:MAG: hypothetical protein PVH41_16735 [Anaerolineae bacterium]
MGLEARTSRRYESEELREVVRELARELGHTPSIAELQARKDLPSPRTIEDRHGRWNERSGSIGTCGRWRKRLSYW